MGGVGEERELVLLSMLLRTGTPSISTRSIYVHIYIYIYIYIYIHVLVPLYVIYSKAVCLLQRKQSRL